jgi:hypothetical protein
MTLTSQPGSQITTSWHLLDSVHACRIADYEHQLCLQPVEWSERVKKHHTYLFELSLLAAASF